MRFIRTHAGNTITVKHILRQVPISRRALERHFLKAIGRTPRQEIARVRIETAKKLLEETNAPISGRRQGVGIHLHRKVFFLFPGPRWPHAYPVPCKPATNTAIALPYSLQSAKGFWLRVWGRAGIRSMNHSGGRMGLPEGSTTAWIV